MKKVKEKRDGRPKSADARYKGKNLYVRLDKLVRRSGKKMSEVVRGLIAEGWVKERIRREHLDYMA